MPLTRISFRSLTLFEDEEWGDTHMAMYATVQDSAGANVAQFKWNNAGYKVNETNTFPLNNDPDDLNTIYFDLNTFGTLTIEAYTDDDLEWPTAASHENALGSASTTFDPQVPETLGSLMIGPTKTDNGNTGYLVVVEVAVTAQPIAADVRLKFENLVLYDDEEYGDSRMAIYIRAKGLGVDSEIFRWNNGGSKVDEVNVYGLDNSPSPTEVRLVMTGPTAITVEGYSDDDLEWPSADGHEHYLGKAIVTIDPSDLSSTGRHQLGPTLTDNIDTGYVVNFSSEILPATPQPDLSINGIEVTQAIQHFHSTLGEDNTVPQVEQKLTLVRVYIDSGVDPSINNGQVPGVTGTLTVSGDANFTLTPLAPFTAQPITTVNPTIFTDTLNFLIPANNAIGTLNLVAQATVGSNVSNPQAVTVTFTPVGQLNILMVRIQTAAVMNAPTPTQYFNAVNELPHLYPIPTNPAIALQYWILPGSQVVTTNHNLATLDGMQHLLNDLEDMREDVPDFIKLYGLVDNALFLNRVGIAQNNTAFGYANLTESVGHELGHVYGLKHAPACGNICPENTDDNFVPSNGLVGEVGVDPVSQIGYPPTFGDFMSYFSAPGQAPGQWISAYDWKKLFERFRGL